MNKNYGQKKFSEENLHKEKRTDKSYNKSSNNVVKNKQTSVSRKSDKSLATTNGYPLRVGILIDNDMNGIVKPLVPNSFEDVFINRKDLNGAPFNMRVVCKIIDAPSDYEDRGRNYYYDSQSGFGMAKGTIVEVLGDINENDPAIAGIMISHDISMDFPSDVKEYQQKFTSDIDLEEIEREIQNGRVDRRNELIITIDGEDAKDLDDAISIYINENNNYILGVHIADVTHYVQEDDPIDKEAIKRGTSVYLVDRVVPMLPQVLSNGLCSLHPGKPKLAVSVIMEWNNNGELIDAKFTESVIESKERFTYDEVYKMLGTPNEKIEKLEKYRGFLETMHKLTTILRENRFNRGAINFEFPETKVKLDINKEVIDVYPAKITFANEMIEECMIACNEVVAQRFALMKAPFIYRVHEQPDSEKMDRFIKIAKLFGEKIHFSQVPKAKEVNKAIDQIQNTPYGSTLMQLLLRSMAKAKYAPKCLGHYGLSSTFYCHFTSPIRRYPDLFIHRVVKAYIKHIKFPASWTKKSISTSEQNSISERNAMLAERESVDFKTAQFMERFVGDTFEGIVTGLMNAGIFVALPNTIEGFAAFRNMANYYEFNENNMTAYCDMINAKIRIGDEVKVKVLKADRVSRRVEFLLDESSLIKSTQSRQRKHQQNNKFSIKNKSNKKSSKSKNSTPNKNKKKR